MPAECGVSFRQENQRVFLMKPLVADTVIVLGALALAVALAFGIVAGWF
jgi:hypothetical protein